jgi:hypothetical protein
MRSKKNERELQDMLAEATEMVPVNSLWRHYKGGTYKVVCIAFDEETLDFEVVYEPVNHPDIHFTRRLSVWLETVKWQGATLPRFEHIAN